MRIPSNAEKEGYPWQIPLNGGHQQRIRGQQAHLMRDTPNRGFSRSLAVSYGQEQRKAMFTRFNIP
jgi:hypothetical protein